MWHASAQTRRIGDSRLAAMHALRGVGDRDLGEWQFAGEKPLVWHVVRRLTDAEREAYGVPDPVDIRGTAEEQRRLRIVLQEMR